MVELKGSLGGIGLPAIVQLIGDLHHSGRLELFKTTARAELGFDDGRLVAATFGDERGLTALVACSRQLADAEFRFVEGEHTGERTIDIDSSQVQRYLSQAQSGDDVDEPVVVARAPAPPQAIVAPVVCTLLGFADDPARHYSRPTALHRCFARGEASLVTGQDQRELCLSGRFASCARFISAAAPPPLSGPSSPAPPPPPPSSPPWPPTVLPQERASLPTSPAPSPLSSPEPGASAPPTVPVAVAAHMRTAAQMQLGQDAPVRSRPDSPGSDGDDAPGDDPDRHTPYAPQPAGRRRRRAPLLVAIGGLLGLLIVAGVLTLVVPKLEGRFAQRSPDAGTQALEPIPTAARAPGVTPRPSDAPGVAAVPTSAAQAGAVQIDAARAAPVASPALGSSSASASPSPAPSSPPVAQAASTPTLALQPLIDVLFSSGPVAGWLDNPPLATWSDGAYRLQARQIGKFIAVGVPVDGAPLGDVVVSATFRKTGGPPGGGSGVIVRDQSAVPLDGVNQNMQAYVLETGDLGEFGVWRRQVGEWIDIVPWTRSPSVRAGGSPNQLTVRAIGPQLTFMVNGTEVARVEDTTLDSGGVGVFVGGDNNEVALDRFTVQVPD